MNIRMIHPIHGEKIATLEAEAKHDEAKGWVRVVALAGALRPSPDPVATLKAEVPALEKRKPGRPKGS